MFQGIVGGIAGGLLITIALYLVVRAGARRNALQDIGLYEGLLEMVGGTRVRLTALELLLAEGGVISPASLLATRKEWETKLAVEEAINPDYADLWTMRQKLEELRRRVEEGRQ